MDRPDFEAMPNEEIIARVVDRQLLFKYGGQVLVTRPPDDRAARALIAAFEAGNAPPWLTAYYLGCLRAPAGYATLRRILREAAGLGSESYAAVAMVRVAGSEAKADLLEAMTQSPEMRSRRGAAYGLRELRDRSTIAPMVRAVSEGFLPSQTMGSVLVQFEVPVGEVIRWLQSSDERVSRMGRHYVLSLRADHGAKATALAVRQAIREKTLDESLCRKLSEHVEALCGSS